MTIWWVRWMNFAFVLVKRPYGGLNNWVETPVYSKMVCWQVKNSFSILSD